MKAKLFVSAKKAEVRMPEGTKTISKLAKEDIEAFKARAIKEIAEDNLIEEKDVTLQTVDAKAVAKFTVEQITEQLVKEAANQKSAKFALLTEALTEKGAEIPEITPEMVAEAKAAAKPKKEAKAPKEPKAKKEPKQKVEVTPEQIEAAKENVGKIISLEKKGETVKGEVISIIEDKRVNRFYYRFKVDGSISHTSITADNLTFEAAPPKPVVEKPAKKKAGKKEETPAEEVPATEDAGETQE